MLGFGRFFSGCNRARFSIWSCREIAHDNPAGPAPTIRTSQSRISRSGICFFPEVLQKLKHGPESVKSTSPCAPGNSVYFPAHLLSQRGKKMASQFKLLSKKTVLTSRVYHVRAEKWRGPTGTFTRDTVVHPGAIAVIPFDAKGRVIMIRQ